MYTTVRPCHLSLPAPCPCSRVELHAVALSNGAIPRPYVRRPYCPVVASVPPRHVLLRGRLPLYSRSEIQTRSRIEMIESTHPWLPVNTSPGGRVVASTCMQAPAYLRLQVPLHIVALTRRTHRRVHACTARAETTEHTSASEIHPRSRCRARGARARSRAPPASLGLLHRGRCPACKCSPRRPHLACSAASAALARLAMPADLIAMIFAAACGDEGGAPW
jgi:hypothetical protein